MPKNLHAFFTDGIFVLRWSDLEAGILKKILRNHQINWNLLALLCMYFFEFIFLLETRAIGWLGKLDEERILTSFYEVHFSIY